MIKELRLSFALKILLILVFFSTIMLIPNPWGKIYVNIQECTEKSGRIQKNVHHQQSDPELGAVEAAKDELGCWTGSGAYAALFT